MRANGALHLGNLLLYARSAQETNLISREREKPSWCKLQSVHTIAKVKKRINATPKKERKFQQFASRFFGILLCQRSCTCVQSGKNGRNAKVRIQSDEIMNF